MKIIERNALSSNLKIILAPMTGIKTITGAFFVRAGWKYETRENNGIAHFLEHMVFRGTEKRTAKDINKEVDSKGGLLNAFTSEEYTYYWLKLPCQHVDFLCDILSDILLHSKFEPAEIEKEKGTVIQELRREHDDPSTYVDLVCWPKLLYGDQSAGRCGIGTEESIGAMAREHFVEFLENLYVAENAIFCLTGKIPATDEAFSLVSNYFHPLKEGPPRISKPPVIESQTEPALFLEARDIEQSHLILGVRACNIYHPKKPALQILNTILGDFASSRICEEIREKRGWAYYVGTFYDAQSDVGTFGTNAGIAREKVLEAIAIIMDEYRRISDEKVSEEELQRAKDFIIGSAQMYFESSNAVNIYLGRQWAMKGKISPFSEEAKKIKAVTSDDVQSVAQEIFINKGLNLAIVGPHQGMEEEFLKILKF